MRTLSIQPGASLADLPLLERGVIELHLALPDSRDVPENEAAARIAAAVIGARVKAGDAHCGQASPMSSERGMLRVHGERLDRVNEHDGGGDLAAG